jgi:hypothetical protein
MGFSSLPFLAREEPTKKEINPKLAMIVRVLWLFALILVPLANAAGQTTPPATRVISREDAASATKTGRQVTLGNARLMIRWTELEGEYRAWNGGGIWYGPANRWMKLADMAEGDASLVEWAKVAGLSGQHLDPEEIPSALPTQIEIIKNQPAEAEVELSGVSLKLSGVEWRVKSRWSIRAGDNKFYWRYTFTPSKAPAEKVLLNVRFNVLPHRFKTVTLPSYCGFGEGVAYAVFPAKDDLWWMRLEGAKLIHNTLYPFSYKATKRAQGAEPVVIQGYFLAAPWSPRQLLQYLHRYFDPQPDEPSRSPRQIMEAAYDSTSRAFQAGVAQNLFPPDEGALIGVANEKGFFHYHMNYSLTAFGVGFSLGWNGQALTPLMTYSQEAGDAKAKEMAVRIGNWLARHAQTDYGAFHEIYDMKLNEGADFINDDLLYTHTTARNAAEMLGLYKATGDKLYLRSGLRACDWLLKIQEPNGAIQWKFVDSTGDVEGPPSYAASSAEALTAWAEAYEITRRKVYLDAARRLADWAERAFVQNHVYGGFITDDRPSNGLNRWENPSPTAICFLIDGFLSLHRVTGEKRYLEIAEEAGEFWGLYQWLWEFPAGSLQYHVKGTTQASGGMNYCIDQTFGSELPLELETLLDLYEASRNPFWLKVFRMAFARLPDCQHRDRGSPLYGSVFEGWSLTKDRVIPGLSGNMLFTNRIPLICLKFMKDNGASH